MPPPFSTTSPVAVATTRILAAYLSYHRLSPAEAVSLSGTIADVLASLAGGVDVKSAPPPPLEEAAPKRAVKPRAPRQPRAEAAGVADTLEPAAAYPEPVTEPDSEPEPALITEVEADPAPASEPIEMAEPEAQLGAVDAVEGPRKRKRPSRPRSKRGKGAGAAPAAAPPPVEAPEDQIVSAAPALESTVDPEVGLLAAEPTVDERMVDAPAAAPKPRRAATSRSRRATTT